MQENKQEKSPIKQKILLYLDKKGITPYDFYKKSGVTRGVLGQNNGISEDNLSRFLAYASDVNVLWLMTGKGDMLCSPPSPNENNICKDKQNISTDQEKSEESSEKDNNTPILSVPHKSDNTALLAFLDRQQYTIQQQAEEIGRLKERIHQLTIEKARNVADAPISDVAHVG